MGSLIGGFIAGTVSLLVARQARVAAEGAWIRDNRREIYDRLLRRAEKLLHACEACRVTNGATEALKANVAAAFTDFFEVYGVVQTVADVRLVNAVRDYTYRLWELSASLFETSVMGVEKFDVVMGLIRDARHKMIDAMRAELGLAEGIRPPEDYNPFAGTELEQEYAMAQRSSPGPWLFPPAARRRRPAFATAWVKEASGGGRRPGRHVP